MVVIPKGRGEAIVEPSAVSPFSPWENFYVIVGSSAAALTGLQFVVVVLGAEARSIGPEVGAFGTPTVVHFCATLLISAILSVPWRAGSNARLALGAVGVAGSVGTCARLLRGRGGGGPPPLAGGLSGGPAPSPLAPRAPLVARLPLVRGH